MADRRELPAGSREGNGVAAYQAFLGAGVFNGVPSSVMAGHLRLQPAARVSLQKILPEVSPLPATAPMSVQPVIKKYTVGSIGIWEKIRRILAVDPERSSGIPLNPTYRNPAPASVPATGYTDPVTIPAADIAENPYWQRDVRRNYPRLSTFRQSDIAGLLSVGSAVNPRIKAGEAGAQQLIAIKEGGAKGALSLAFEKGGGKAIGDVLGPGGLPPLPGAGVSWVIDNNEGFLGKYPCRNFR